MTLKEILEFNFFSAGEFELNLYHILAVVLIYTIAKVFTYLANKLLIRYFGKKKVDRGRSFAVLQFLKYIIYTVATLLALDAIGIELSVIWGGAAALLVGIGLGLQQTFNDLISGLILLMEGTIEVDDIVQVDGIVGIVKTIGIRTSKIETRDKISKLVPNSRLVGETATNWSHNEKETRFQTSVGVAYGSDVLLVTKLLLQAVEADDRILKNPAPRIQFKDFGNSSLDFDIHFFTEDLWGIEWIKSDLRYKITALFKEHNIEIPFPQRDLWFKNPDALANVLNK